MALIKESAPINFASGLDQKTDPYQVAPGKFLRLENTVFTKGGLLSKRNGFGQLADLPDDTSTFVTTFNGNLTAISDSLTAYSEPSNTWINKGMLQPLELSVLPLIRSNLNQAQADSVVSSNGFVCTVYTDQVPSGGSIVPSYKYAVADSTTGQNVIAPTVIPVSSGTVTGSPRAFLLGNYFIIVVTNNVGGTYHLQYTSISTVNPSAAANAIDLSTQYTPATTVAFDGVVCNNNLYLAWNGNDGGGAVRITYLDSTLVQHNTVVFSGHAATLVSLCADTSNSTPVIYTTFYALGTTNGYTFAVNQQLNTVLAPTQTITTETVLNITSASAQAGQINIYYEISNTYGYDAAIATNYIKTKTITQAGVVSAGSTVIRSVGLASKAFTIDSVNYFLTVYASAYQPSYFLVTSSGQVAAKVAYQNGSGYYTLGLPSANITDSSKVYIAYFFKDLIQAANKSQGVASAAGVYSQLGVNLVTFDLGITKIATAEIGQDLHLTGGFLWMYDGYMPVEHGFHVWPDYVEATTSATGGNLTAQQYYYQATYEWSDNQGNIFRSAPSIPVTVTTTGATSSNTINVPTLRLTYKTANPVKIVIYRWSVAQQTYYQITSISMPLLNSTSVDYVSFVDTQADSAIIGNNIIYTTGGVLENIAAPAASVITLFNNRLVLIPSEDSNNPWYSKQVVAGVPVEMSDLLTFYAAPTAGSQGSTGKTKTAFPMDDKLILGKDNAFYYINGNGPDNTGANSQYSEAIFITSTVGCSNQNSIVFMPNGLMFQSGRGIWLLGRDLTTQYIGAAVEDYTDGATVLSALNVPNTNQVRFTLDTGVTLMYDYYFGQWGAFVNVPALSSTVYNNFHTYINASGQVFQETPGVYLDGSKPVLLSFTTSWFNLAGLQSYMRAYHVFLLATYYSPHKINVGIAYDYNDSITQSSTITPDNFTPNWGGEQLWGSGGPWGGPGNIEQWRVDLTQQRCQAFQLTITEQYDGSLGQPAGAGFSMSGLNLIVGVKKKWPSTSAARQIG